MLAVYPALTCSYGVQRREDGRYIVVQVMNGTAVVIASYKSERHARIVAEDRANMNRIPARFGRK